MRKKFNLLDYIDPWAVRLYKYFMFGMPVVYAGLMLMCWLAPVAQYPQLKAHDIVFMWCAILHPILCAITLGLFLLLVHVLNAMVHLGQALLKR